MRSTTRKLTGPALERLFGRLLIESGGMDGVAAERVARRLALVLTSVRVRRVPLKALQKAASRPPTPASAPYLPATASRPESSAAVPAASAPEPEKPFDPYAFGLVPVFQREGRDGLAAKLAVVASAAHLRAMAKAQQIALTPELRTGDVPLAELRAAIVAAVEKRIADRRAAAG